MSLARFYVADRQVIVPTVAITEAGFYVDIEPVAVIDIRDAAFVKESLLAVLNQENRQIPTPKRVDAPGSVILETMNLKKWQVFERKAVLYTVHKGDEAIVVYATGRGADGLWVEDRRRHRTFDLATPLAEIVDYIFADMLTLPEAAPRPVLMLPPPKEPS
jgi:hypothetical protein